MSVKNLFLFTDTQLAKHLNVTKNGSPVDLTGAKIIFQSHLNRCDETPTLNKEITEISVADEVGQIDDPLNGGFFVYFTKENTAETFDGTWSLRWYIDKDEDENVIISSDPCAVGKFKICCAG